MHDAAVVIPARLGSTRLNNKALLPLNGKPMVVHVAERAQAAPGISRVIVATDAQEIVDAVTAAGFEARMTSANCASGTDRVAEVARDLKEAIIVNLQGDEPLMPPEAIAAAAKIIADGRAKMGSCMAPFTSRAEFMDPSQVKVLVNRRGEALYFSRSTIPFNQAHISDTELWSQEWLGRHLGLYSYDRDFLLEFSALPAVALESIESLEQLRALYHGQAIVLERIATDAFGVNTAEELELMRRRLEG